MTSISYRKDFYELVSKRLSESVFTRYINYVSVKIKNIKKMKVMG